MSGTENRRVLKNNIHAIPNRSARFLFFACKNSKKSEIKRNVCNYYKPEKDEETDLSISRTSWSGTRQGSETLLPLLQPLIFLNLESQTSQ